MQTNSLIWTRMKDILCIVTYSKKIVNPNRNKVRKSAKNKRKKRNERKTELKRAKRADLAEISGFSAFISNWEE